MKKLSLIDISAIIVWLLPLCYLAYLYPTLPSSVALHYNMQGKVDNYGPKSTFLVVQFILLCVAALVYLLLRFIPGIDPKKNLKYSLKTFQKVALAIVIFMAALTIIFTYATAHHGVNVDRLIFPVIGLLFVFMGNVMHSIKPNYFVGIKTPWTLENPDNWRATHMLAGKLWFIGGIILTILMLFLSAPANFYAFLIITVILGLVPVVFSYKYFKGHRLNQNS